jgi:hypothetical protein
MACPAVLSCGDTAHVPPIQVGTPRRGKTHRFNTNHATSTAAGNSQSHIVPPILFFMGRITSRLDPVGLQVNYIPKQE